ncbi:PLP-dependent aminotransferase family protein [Hydrogenophaga sp. 5NK40-0174]|uniref:aminotransferase-like domain-containing protein n=1 Tax=Hydrogenophaga sp. 5NK40-0174 TaxID=3127649 RepID=UPI0031031D5A
MENSGSDIAASIVSPVVPAHLARHGAQTITEQLAARYASLIRERLLAPGAKLPSVRQCASQHGINPSTVVTAYDMLQAQGLVEARPQRGYFVREQSMVRAVTPADRKLVKPAPPVNAATLIRGMFQPPGERAQPAAGVFPPDWLDAGLLTSALRKATSQTQLGDLSLRYGDPLGDAELRRVLAMRLQAMGMPVQANGVITTVGATHALDVVSRTMLKPGDKVMVEQPGWAVEFARLGALGMEILPVPRTSAGPDLGVMERFCQLHRPKLYVSVSVLHNPTGHCLNPASAHRVLQLAHQYDFHVVEDDTYGHIAPPHSTRMSVLDGLQRTIYVSGFAKILAPNWRVGYLAAPEPLLEPLLDTKLLGTLTTPSVMERALAIAIEQGHLRRHIERVRQRLDEARTRSVKQALAAGCDFVSEPAGLFGWVDTGVDTELLSQRMLDEGYLIAPGTLFQADRSPSTLMRINFATTQDATFWKVFRRLLADR